MESTSYLLGYEQNERVIYRLLAQEEEYRKIFITKLSDFPALLCELHSYPEHTMSAMLFALQSFVLSDLGKNTLVQNTQGILQSLVQLSQGRVSLSMDSD